MSPIAEDRTEREWFEFIIGVRQRIVNGDPVSDDEVIEAIKVLRFYNTRDWRRKHWAAKAWAIFLSRFYRVFPWIWEWRENR